MPPIWERGRNMRVRSLSIILPMPLPRAYWVWRGVEKAMTSLNARTTYVKHVVEFTAAAVILFLAVYILFLHRDMTHPILAITDEAK